MDASGINRYLRGYFAKTLNISAARYLRYSYFWAARVFRKYLIDEGKAKG